MRLTTVRSVGIGFGILTLLLVCTICFTLIKVGSVQSTTDELVEKNAPITDATFRISSGLNESLANLRGYLLVGDKSLKDARAANWVSNIEPASRNLQQLVSTAGGDIRARHDIDSLTRTHHASLTDEEKVALIVLKLDELKISQEKVERMIEQEESESSTTLMLGQATPLSTKIVTAITALIDEEAEMTASPERRVLLKYMADFRGSFSYALAALQGRLLSGDSQFEQTYQKYWAINQTAYDGIVNNESLLSETQKTNFADLGAALAEFEPLAKKLLSLESNSQASQATAVLSNEAMPVAELLQETLGSLLSDIAPRVVEKRQTLTSEITTLTILLWGSLGIGLLVSVLVSSFIIRNVQTSIAEVAGVSQDVSAASSQIAAGAQEQVATLNETTASLNAISTTAEEFKATMQEFVDRSRAVREAADDTAQRTQEGGRLTQESAERIDQVQANAAAAGESVYQLSEQMQRIGEITATVNEIAEQTKLLALNASIEAARAGEDGRGFAVVATQVRELANQSKESSRRIEGLIGDAQKSMQNVVKRIEEGGRLSQQSAESVREMAHSFSQISEAIEQTRDAMAQINTGARQQEDGIVELVTSITQIDSGSKESLAAAEQTQNAIASIDGRIQSLNDLMEKF